MSAARTCIAKLVNAAVYPLKSYSKPTDLPVPVTVIPVVLKAVHPPPSFVLTSTSEVFTPSSSVTVPVIESEVLNTLSSATPLIPSKLTAGLSVLCSMVKFAVAAALSFPAASIATTCTVCNVESVYGARVSTTRLHVFVPTCSVHPAPSVTGTGAPTPSSPIHVYTFFTGLASDADPAIVIVPFTTSAAACGLIPLIVGVGAVWSTISCSSLTVCLPT